MPPSTASKSRTSRSCASSSAESFTYPRSARERRERSMPLRLPSSSMERRSSVRRALMVVPMSMGTKRSNTTTTVNRLVLSPFGLLESS